MGATDNCLFDFKPATGGGGRKQAKLKPQDAAKNKAHSAKEDGRRRGQRERPEKTEKTSKYGGKTQRKTVKGGQKSGSRRPQKRPKIAARAARPNKPEKKRKTGPRKSRAFSQDARISEIKLFAGVFLKTLQKGKHKTPQKPKRYFKNAFLKFF